MYKTLASDVPLCRRSTAWMAELICQHVVQQQMSGKNRGATLTITVPYHVVPRGHLGNMHHCFLQLQMRMQSLGELLSMTRCRALEVAGHLVSGGKLPVIHIQKALSIPYLSRRPNRTEEWPQQRVHGTLLDQRIHQQRPLPRPGSAHRQPPLKHPKHAAAAKPAVQVGDGIDAAGCLPRVVRLPLPAEDCIVDAAAPVPVCLPPLHAAAVGVRAEAEFGVAGLADAEAVGVGEGSLEGDGRVGVRGVPEGGHQGFLGFHE